eukprot:COSAG02_NODE_689_length_18462_cov_36.417470_12_plen_190_part_00
MTIVSRSVIIGTSSALLPGDAGAVTGDSTLNSGCVSAALSSTPISTAFMCEQACKRKLPGTLPGAAATPAPGEQLALHAGGARRHRAMSNSGRRPACMHACACVRPPTSAWRRASSAACALRSMHDVIAVLRAYSTINYLDTRIECCIACRGVCRKVGNAGARPWRGCPSNGKIGPTWYESKAARMKSE